MHFRSLTILYFWIALLQD